MPRKSVQMSLLDIYKDVENRLETDKPALFKLLDEHIKWYEIIPDSFYLAFYKQFGRSRKYQLESFMRALFLQRIFHYVEDSQLLNTLRFSREMRDYCELDKVPDASKLTRFKQDFCEHIRGVFENLVELTESICREIDKNLQTCLHLIQRESKATLQKTIRNFFVARNNRRSPFLRLTRHLMIPEAHLR